jgi:hypothetical protein
MLQKWLAGTERPPAEAERDNMQRAAGLALFAALALLAVGYHLAFRAARRLALNPADWRAK